MEPWEGAHSSTRNRCSDEHFCSFSMSASSGPEDSLCATSDGWSLLVGGRPGCRLTMGPGTTRSFQKPELIVGTVPYSGSCGKTCRFCSRDEFTLLTLVLQGKVSEADLAECRAAFTVLDARQLGRVSIDGRRS